MTGNKDAERIIDNLKRRRAALAPGSPALRKAMTLVGTLVVADMKRLIHTQKIKESGTLVNNAGFTFAKEGDSSILRVGVFGVRYASFHEFGTKPSSKMYWFLRKRWEEDPRVRKKPSKGVIEYSGGPGGPKARIKPRPFLRPALEKNKESAIEIIWEALNK